MILLGCDKLGVGYNVKIKCGDIVVDDDDSLSYARTQENVTLVFYVDEKPMASTSGYIWLLLF